MLVLGIIFIAFNLRAALTSVGPLISSIREDMHISNGAAGLLTALPLLAFAALSLFTPHISRAVGNEWAIAAGLAALLLGMLVRSSGWVFGLFSGTVFIGSGIAIFNVLLPSVIKSKFPMQVGLMTSIYTTCMGICAMIASGVSVPLAHGLGLGWQWTLLGWGLLTIVAMAVWLPQLKNTSNRGEQPRSMTGTVWRSPLAWKLTFFMGLQSFLFYSLITWLPEIVRYHGMSASTAGWMLAFMQLVGLPSTFFTPVLAGRCVDQRGIAIGIGALYFIGIAGLLFGGNLALIVLWCLLIGVGQGASISLSLTLIGLRAVDPEQTAALSGMAQSFGYLVAAFGPVAVGALFDSSGVWVYPLAVLLIVTVGMVLAGVGAGRNKTVGTEIPARM